MPPSPQSPVLPPRAKRIKRAVRFALLRSVWLLVGLLPLTLASRLGGALGRLAFWLVAGERANALRSLAVAFPEKSESERRALAHASFAHFGAGVCELACVDQLNRELEVWVDFPEEARQVLRRALARGKGVVFSTGHVGNWELLARSLGLLVCEFVAVGRETSDPRMTRWVEDYRKSANVSTLWRGQEGAARHLLRTLRGGRLLALLIDQDTRVQSVFVPFFGHLAATPRAAADLVLRTGAGLVTGYCQRVGPGPRYRVQCREVTVTASDNRDGDVLALTTELTRDIETVVRAHPEQWVWMHQRWHTQPPTPLAEPVRPPGSNSAADLRVTR